MQPSVRTGWFRRALLGVAVVLSAVGAIGIAWAVSADPYALPGAEPASAGVEAPAA